VRFSRTAALARPLAVISVAAAARALAAPAAASLPLVPGDAFHHASTYDSTTDVPGRSPFADGSYHWSEYLSFTSGIVRGTGSVASDGSAKLTSSLPGHNAGTTTFGTPLTRKTGHAIPVTSQGFNQLPAPPLAAKTVYVPDWYPGDALAPRPLLVDTEINEGRSITPPACGIRAGRAAFDLHESARSLDPLAGSLIVTTTDEFDVAVFGNVCTISKTVSAYYDNMITGNLIQDGVSTSVTVLTGVSGPRPSAEPFSLDVTQANTYLAQFFPDPVDPGLKRRATYRPSLPKSLPT
jgi:hypothetical protein